MPGQFKPARSGSLFPVRLTNPCKGIGKIARLEWLQIIRPLTDPDSMNRQSELFRQGDNDAPFCRAIEFCDNQTADIGKRVEPLNQIAKRAMLYHQNSVVCHTHPLQ